MTARLVRERVPLNICLTSNLTLLYRRREDHPLRRLLDAGAAFLRPDDAGREKRVFSILNSTVLWGIILPLNSENGGISLMVTITKDTIIGDILDVAPQTAPIFLSIGMHCLGCPSSRGETVEEACMVHGVDVDKLLALVNEEANKAQ